MNTDPQLRQPFAAPFIGDDLADPGVDCERIALAASVVDLDVPLVVDGGLERLDDRRYVKVTAVEVQVCQLLTNRFLDHRPRKHHATNDEPEHRQPQTDVKERWFV